MNRIGIIGGLSYQSSKYYYDRLNSEVHKRLGGDASADMVLVSVNFEDFTRAMKTGQDNWLIWQFRKIAEHLAKMGCEYMAVASNTMHKYTEQLMYNSSYEPTPGFVDIAECAGMACIKRDIHRVLLIGTAMTMTEDFMKQKLKMQGIEVVNAFNKREIGKINRIIFNELCRGRVTVKSSQWLYELLEAAVAETKAEGVILGCTELNMIIHQRDVQVPVIDTTEEHVKRLAELCLD